MFVKWISKPITLALFFTVSNIHTQTSRNELNISAGLNDFHIKDERITTAIFRGDLYDIRLSYQYLTENTIHDFKIDLNIGSIESFIKEYDVSQYNFEISYGFYKNIKILSNDNFKTFAGSAFNSLGLITQLKNPGYLVYNELTWYWKNSIDIVALEKIKLYKNNFLHVALDIPLLKFISRPVYSNSDINEDGNLLHVIQRSRLSFFPGAFSFESEIKYINEISRYLDLNLLYGFRFATASFPLNMGMFCNNFSMGIAWKF